MWVEVQVAYSMLQILLVSALSTYIEKGREWLNRLNAETLWKGQLLKGNHAVNFSLGKTASLKKWTITMYISTSFLALLAYSSLLFCSTRGLWLAHKNYDVPMVSPSLKTPTRLMKMWEPNTVFENHSKRFSFHSISKNRYIMCKSAQETFSIDFQTLWSQMGIIAAMSQVLQNCFFLLLGMHRGLLCESVSHWCSNGWWSFCGL